MSKQELLAKLKWLGELENASQVPHAGDTEWIHGEADAALLEFINDEEIAGAFDAISKWYS